MIITSDALIDISSYFDMSNLSFAAWSLSLCRGSRVEGRGFHVEGRGYHVSSGGQESKCQVDVSQRK